MLLTVDTTTSASNPGEIIISIDKYIEYYNIAGIQKLALKVLTGLPKNLSRTLFPNWNLLYNWINRYEQFRYGCISPSVVVDKTNGIVAAFTSLTAAGDIPKPVIKLFTEKLHLIVDKDVHNGERLASVALYTPDSQNPTSPYWKDFTPLVADCFSADSRACETALNSMNDACWECLFRGLEQIEDKSKTGLYHVKLPVALVNAAN